MKKVLFLVSMMLVFIAAPGSHAQVKTMSPETAAAEFQSVVSKAMDTAVIQNGKLRSLKISLPGDRERWLTLEHSSDDRSFAIIEDGRKIRVVLDDSRRISEIVFPNGRSLKYEWVMTPSGYWVPASIKLDGKEVRRSNTLVNDDDCAPICERAAQAAIIALGVCTAAGPLTLACWTATAVAAASAYQCYRCTHPEVEEPPESLFETKQRGVYGYISGFEKRRAQASARNQPDSRRCDLLYQGELQ